ncbi:unnamed protein product [Candidula unifasciata]|uniref:Uncharacterized protein n=1 Tax=Candidula unifasciata TaxID=100452 RepID=A0A8S3ZTA3_9EUPU|nr:unnamed protein product [Candidula unifasciata]
MMSPNYTDPANCNSHESALSCSGLNAATTTNSTADVSIIPSVGTDLGPLLRLSPGTHGDSISQVQHSPQPQSAHANHPTTSLSQLYLYQQQQQQQQQQHQHSQSLHYTSQVQQCLNPPSTHHWS